MGKIRIFIFGMAALAGIYSGWMNLSLNKKSSELALYNSRIEQRITLLNKAIEKKDKEIQGLSNAAAIKSALAKSEGLVDQLGKEFERVNNERLALQEENNGLKTRFENISREYNRASQELNAAKIELSNIDKNQIQPLKNKIDEFSSSGSYTRQESQPVDKEPKADSVLRKRISELENQKDTLEARLAGMEKETGREGISARGLQSKINQLNISIQDKEEQISFLEAELVKLNSSNSAFRKQFNLQQDEINKLEANNRVLKSQVSQQAPLQESQQLDNSKGQLNQVSGILVRKELELEKARKDSLDAADKIINLQGKLAELEKDISVKKSNEDKLRELETEKFNLQSRLSDLDGEVTKKAEVISSLQKNLEYLNFQLSKKDEEKKSVENKLKQLDSLKNTTQDELTKQKMHIEEVDLLYNSLRTQVEQLSDMLKQKEAELSEKQKEIYSLKEDIIGLKSSSMQLESDLREAKERQKKTLDDLSSAVRLNSALQQKLSTTGTGNAEQKQDTKDKQSADDLRRKIEVILEPEK